MSGTTTGSRKLHPSRFPNPQRWWSRPLDSEQLARTTVLDARDAARQVAASRDIDCMIEADSALTAASFNGIGPLRIDGAKPTAWAPLSGFFPTADGWVRTHANYPRHAATLERALGAPTSDELIASLSRLTAQEFEDAFTAERGIAAAVRTPQQWMAHPHGAATTGEPWTFVTTTGCPTCPLSKASAVLQGVHVLDLARVIAGPTCSQLLACLGAEVLRIDPPDRPEL